MGQRWRGPDARSVPVAWASRPCVHGRDARATQLLLKSEHAAGDYSLIDVLLTNAIRVLSGAHDGTLIVPCPPNT